MTADLSRTNGGYTVAVSFLPTLADPMSALVDVSLGAVTIGAVTVAAVDGWTAYRHTALYVSAYADALNVKGDTDVCS